MLISPNVELSCFCCCLVLLRVCAQCYCLLLLLGAATDCRCCCLELLPCAADAAGNQTLRPGDGYIEYFMATTR